MLTSLSQLPQRKASGPKLAVLTAYDYPTARLLDEAGVIPAQNQAGSLVAVLRQVTV